MTMTTVERIRGFKQDMAELALEIDFLEKLPANLDIKSVYGRPDHWDLTVTGKLQEMLALLPAAFATMSIVRGEWTGQPENRPMDFNERYLPVIENSSGLTWFHYMPDGMLVKVTLASARMPIVPGFQMNPARHTRVCERKPVTPPVTSGYPREQASESWAEFSKKEGYRANQMQFMRVFSMLANRNIALSMDMLPTPNAQTMEVAGESLVICQAGNSSSPESYPADSPLAPLARIGDFWKVFTPSQAERLIAFVNANLCDLEAETARAGTEQFGQVQKALTRFEELYLTTPPANAVSTHVLQYWIQLQTGLKVSISGASDDKRAEPGTMRLSIGLTWYTHKIFSLAVPVGPYHPEGFDFDSPSFVEYESNQGRF